MLTNNAFRLAIGLQLAAGALLAAAAPPATTPGWMTRPAVGTSKRDARAHALSGPSKRPLAWGNVIPPSRRPAPARTTPARTAPGLGSVTLADPKAPAAAAAPAAIAASAVTPPSLPVPAAERPPYIIRGLELPGLATTEERAALPSILSEMKSIALARPPRPPRVFWRERSNRPALPPENTAEASAARPATVKVR